MIFSNIYKKIYYEIKKYPNIVIARHIGADPDALGSQFALRELIKNKFPKKLSFEEMVFSGLNKSLICYILLFFLFVVLG